MHASLKPRTNLRLLAVWLLSAIVMSVLAKSTPWILLASGVILGAIGGGVQLRVFRQAPDALLASNTLMDVRRAMTSTSAGRLYFYVLWASVLLLLALSIYLLGKDFPPGWAAGYCALGFTRELVTLRGVLELASI